jgi:hypothetical protein
LTRGDGLNYEGSRYLVCQIARRICEAALTGSMA